MNILAITDSKIPNPALMKLKRWYWNKGHLFGFDIKHPDAIVISCIFTKNFGDLLGAVKLHPSAILQSVGGPGATPPTTLPREIEKLKPDYSLYPDFKDSIGYVTAGCPRNCYFCIVPQMYNRQIHYVQPVQDFYHGGTCRVLDDNILAYPGAFSQTTNWLIEHDIKTKFEYLDIRLLQEHHIKLLSELKRGWKTLYFAYDITNNKTEEIIKKNTKLLLDYGLSKTGIGFYIYLHDKNHIQDAAHRWGFIRNLGFETFLMCNSDNICDYKLKKRGCRPAIWRGMTPEEVFGLPKSGRISLEDFAEVSP